MQSHFRCAGLAALAALGALPLGLRADEVSAAPERNETMEFLAQGDHLRSVAATGLLELARGQSFTRAIGGSCSR